VALHSTGRPHPCACDAEEFELAIARTGIAARRSDRVPIASGNDYRSRQTSAKCAYGVNQNEQRRAASRCPKDIIKCRKRKKKKKKKKKQKNWGEQTSTVQE
jgi:hypothetical protein